MKTLQNTKKTEMPILNEIPLFEAFLSNQDDIQRIKPYLNSQFIVAYNPTTLVLDWGDRAVVHHNVLVYDNRGNIVLNYSTYDVNDVLLCAVLSYLGNSV